MGNTVLTKSVNDKNNVELEIKHIGNTSYDVKDNNGKDEMKVESNVNNEIEIENAEHSDEPQLQSFSDDIKLHTIVKEKKDQETQTGITGATIINNDGFETYWIFHDDSLKGPYIATEIYSLYIRDQIEQYKTQIKKSFGNWYVFDLKGSMKTELPYLHSILMLSKSLPIESLPMSLPSLQTTSTLSSILIRFIGLIISKLIIIIIVLQILPILTTLFTLFSVLAIVALLAFCICFPCVICVYSKVKNSMSSDCCGMCCGMVAVLAFIGVIFAPAMEVYFFIRHILVVPLKRDCGCCSVIDLNAYQDEDDFIIDNRTYVGIVISFILTPIMVIVLLIEYGIYDEMESWMIGYVVWANAFYIDFVFSIKTEWYRDFQMIILGINVPTTATDDVLIYLSALTSMFPAAITAFIANYFLQEKFALDCGVNIVSDICDENGGCCEIISSHNTNNIFDFAGDIASNILAAFAFIRILTWLRIKADPQLFAIATQRQ